MLRQAAECQELHAQPVQALFFPVQISPGQQRVEQVTGRAFGDFQPAADFRGAPTFPLSRQQLQDLKPAMNSVHPGSFAFLHSLRVVKGRLTVKQSLTRLARSDSFGPWTRAGRCYPVPLAEACRIMAQNWEDDKPPFLGTWRRLYAAVIGFLFLLILLFYVFTRAY